MNYGDLERETIARQKAYLSETARLLFQDRYACAESRYRRCGVASEDGVLVGLATVEASLFYA